MKTTPALSIRQPWAWLIVHCDEYRDPKRVENRTWPTGFRGPLLIHAGKKFDSAGYDLIIELRPDLARLLPEPGAFDLGGLVGRATVIDCVTESTSWWFTGPCGFVLADARPLKFLPYPGRLGFFNIPTDALRPQASEILNTP